MTEDGLDHRPAKKAKRTHRDRITPKSYIDERSSEDELATTENSTDQLAHISQVFENIGITELLELDSRPTFVLDLQPTDGHADDRLNVVFCNKSLRFFDELRNVIHAETFYPSDGSTDSSTPTIQTGTAVEFREWATSFSGSSDSVDGYMPRHTFRGMFWTSATLRNRWRVISASQVPNQRRQSHGTPKSSRSTSRSTSTTRSCGESTSTLQEDELSRQLADSESKFRVLTELNPVGMYYLSPDGNVLYANDMWYEITGHPRGLESEMSFMNVLSESEHDLMRKEWEILTTQRGKRTFELRLRNPWRDEKSGKMKQKWILASCDQEFDEDGNLKSIMGCITDISMLKHVEEDAIERANLVEKLALRTEEAAHHARNFQQMAELAPCGMFTFDLGGRITWANSQWYEMTGHPRCQEDHYCMSFLNSVERDDHDAFHADWKRLIEFKEEITCELRLKKPWIRQEKTGAVRDSTWILFLALPQLDDDGNLVKIFGCTTDISHFKWAESVQLTSRLHAEEAKRQQEAFIDMTSHEMRNPLSAIMLCADGIANSLVGLKSHCCTPTTPSSAIPQDLIESNIEAAQTITLCAQHQKRIIDDILTLSKLDSSMLQVSPVQVQVESTVRGTLKMFDSELQAHNISMSFSTDATFDTAQVDWVCCDPARLTQVFINLLTNAIKFTRSEKIRKINITLSASTSRPPKDTASDIQWFPSNDLHAKQDPTLTPEWGTGQQIYLSFSVKDTGRGLTEDEMTRLFNRFSQANPKTHVQYGGSGLGLFISRELTELQGGEIGVASKAGAGSTFAFYIKARRASGSESGSQTGEVIRKDSAKQLPSSRSLLSSPNVSAMEGLSPAPLPHKTPRNYHILLVEDNLINQKVLSKQLRNAGCTVHVANHGGEALDFVARTKLWKGNEDKSQTMSLSIILMDLEMPVMDGLAASRAIRDFESEGKLKHIPIIAVTANARAEQMSVALEAGMDDIVPKPFQIPELMEKIDRLLEPSSIP